jgi:hypothetical protein
MFQKLPKGPIYLERTNSFGYSLGGARRTVRDLEAYHARRGGIAVGNALHAFKIALSRLDRPHFYRRGDGTWCRLVVHSAA